MARIRSLKPQFFTSEDVVSLSWPARLLFPALWCEADREGRLEWRPGTIKLRYFPADNVDIALLATELVDRKMLEIYEVEGKTYATLPSFKRHQVINNRESESILPAKPDACPTRDDASKTAKLHVLTPLVGREGRKGTRVASHDDGKFARFWEAYPRKMAKADAFKAWRKINPDGALTERILAAVERAAAGPDWRKDGGKFIPYPASYLNGGRFDDELRIAVPHSASQVPL